MAFTAVAAVIGAGEAATATMVLAAVAEVGTAMAVVGAVTGNKELTKIGGTMALVGGIGGAIAGIGGTATGVAAEGAGATLKGIDAAAGDAFSGASAAGDAAIANYGSSAAGMAADADLAGGLNPGLDPTAPAAMDVGGTQATATSAPASTSMPVGAEQETGLQASAPSGAQAPDGVIGPTSPADTYPEAQSIRNANSTDTSLIGGSGAPQGFGDYFKSFSKFANDNKTLFNAGMQIVGGAMKGANDREMFDQQLALNQQRVNQTSYGNTVGNFAPTTKGGIISGVRA